MVEQWMAIWKMIKLDLFLMPHTRIKSNSIRDLTIKTETIQVLKENMHEFL